MHVRRAGAGDASSLAWVVERFSPLLRAQARYRLRGELDGFCDPDDLVQDVWVRTLPRMTDLVATDDRATPRVVKFLSTALLNHINNLLMRELRRGTRPFADTSQLPEPSTSNEGVLTRADRGDKHERVLATIESLADDDREILVLRAIEQRDNRQVAETLGITPNAAAVRYHRAMQRLRDQLPGSIFDELHDQEPRS